jgi:hypothetical protein
LRPHVAPGILTDVRRSEAEWEGLRLVLVEHPGAWWAFVYDPQACEVLYTAERMDETAAKFAAIEFAVISAFVGRQKPTLETIAKTLIWKTA